MTPERFKRISDMLAQRQLDLTVCMEEVHKPHNLAAIVRTADAIGIHREGDGIVLCHGVPLLKHVQ